MIVDNMQIVNVCDCGCRETVWVVCDGCGGYDYVEHKFLCCANCSATSEPFTEWGE
jgi:hypothetical protein